MGFGDQGNLDRLHGDAGQLVKFGERGVNFRFASRFSKHNRSSKIKNLLTLKSGCVSIVSPVEQTS